jgi:hypothetical protein
MGHAKEMIMGDPRELSNAHNWSMVRLNLSGLEFYDPRMVWVAKVRPDGRFSAYLFIYMDDFRPTGPDDEECRQANRKAGSICNHLGIQDAPRQRRGHH